MKERPILFTGTMVCALLTGAKTQTRRIVKPARDRELGCELAPCEIAGEINAGDYRNSRYGRPGDRLWVKETHLAWWSLNPDNPKGPRVFSHVAAFAADGYQLEPGERWVPSIHMCRKASRILLEIVQIRVERLQSISEADAIAEGITQHGENYAWVNEARFPDGKRHFGAGAYDLYRQLWGTINGPGSWDANPWVWVVEFKLVTR